MVKFYLINNSPNYNVPKLYIFPFKFLTLYIFYFKLIKKTLSAKEKKLTKKKMLLLALFFLYKVLSKHNVT